jgi:hypothetical protein
MPSVSIFGGSPRVTKIVLREQFTGDGSGTTFQLTNSPDNCTFDKGIWTAASIETGYPAHVTGTDKKATYDSLLPLARHRIAVSSIDASGLVTLDYAPRSSVDFYIWYWYTLAATDEITYYREDFVASMEGEAAVLGSDITLDTTNFNGILSESDTTVQAALETVDDYSGGGGYAVYVEEGDAAKANSSAADLYVDFDGTDFDVGAVGNECNVSLNWARSINLTTIGTHEYQIGGNRALAMPVGNSNVAIGYQTLNSVTTGLFDVAIGYETLKSLTEGLRNVGIGTQALSSVTTNSNNVGIGFQALLYQTGANNVGLGYQALRGSDGLSTADNNSAFGYHSLYSNTTGIQNAAVGNQTLEANTTGGGNVAIGYQALWKAIAESGNIAIGVQALGGVLTNGNNIGIGTGVMSSGTSVVYSIGIGILAQWKITEGHSGIAIGYRADAYNQTGDYNIAIGREALEGVSGNSHSNNIAIGYKALTAITTGGNNICIGHQAGDNLTIGSNNIIIGYQTDASAVDVDDELNIGNAIYGNLAAATKNITINAATVSANYDLMLAGDGVLGLKEASTPTADADYGKIYFKNDNKLYAQTGDGVEHEVAFA